MRKRKRNAHAPDCPAAQVSASSNAPLNKRAKRDAAPTAPRPHHVTHPVLSQYYPQLQTLRGFLLGRLPLTSTRRRRALQQCRCGDSHEQTKADDELAASSEDADGVLAQLLDTTLVGSRHQDEQDAGEPATRSNQAVNVRSAYRVAFADFSQAQSMTMAGTAAATATATHRSGPKASQATEHGEIVDFAVWLLFHRTWASSSRPPHMLCHGLQRAAQTCRGIASTVPGLRQVQYNEHLEFMRGPLWRRAFNLLGRGGDAVLLEMILHCGVFIAVPKAADVYYQLSGEVLSELQVRERQPAQPRKPQTGNTRPDSNKQQGKELEKPRKPTEIRFVRHRMLYSRPQLTANLKVSLGMRHIHVLRRFPDPDRREHTTHILKYMFPRQFRLDNVFTSITDARETSQPFKDYTLREQELAWARQRRNFGRGPGSGLPLLDPVPRRLRGKAFALVAQMQRLSRRCSYELLLRHYCPVASSGARDGQADEDGDLPHFTLLASPVAQVSAFCQAVVRNVVPRAWLGGDGNEEEGEGRQNNWHIMMRNIDTFLRARRFETFSLEEMLRGLHIKDIEWLRPANADASDNIALSDFDKRRQLLAEFVYYLFDSLLIPLVRSNFYVTESGVHKNRLFYFRHDVWRRMTEPHLASLKTSLYEEVGGASALQALSLSASKASQLRLLPKDKGMRTILNLRRRQQTMVNGKLKLSRSVNATLKPAFTVLNFEKQRRPGKFGGSLFSVGDMYEKVRTFRQSLAARGQLGARLYFVKVDVKSCFDSLPQDKVVQLVKRLLASSQYDISRCCEMTLPAGQRRRRDDHSWATPAKKFITKADASGGAAELSMSLSKSAAGLNSGVVFVDGVVTQRVEREDMFALVEDHVRHNLVRLGKTFYRQKQGIAQGSVLSSLLCNLLFADFERRRLGAVTSSTSMMMRLTDDFLLVTTEKAQAEQFLATMHSGSPEYGIAVKPEKSLVNFETQLGASQVARLSGLVGRGDKFPFCGMLIDTKTLDMVKDDARNNGATDGLSVEYSARPGRMLLEKITSTLKMQLHTMLLDTTHNSRETVAANVWRALLEAAARSLCYVQSVPALRRPNRRLLIGLVERVAAAAVGIMRSRRHQRRHGGYRCEVSAGAVKWCVHLLLLWSSPSHPSQQQQQQQQQQQRADDAPKQDDGRGLCAAVEGDAAHGLAGAAGAPQLAEGSARGRRAEAHRAALAGGHGGIAIVAGAWGRRPRPGGGPTGGKGPPKACQTVPMREGERSLPAHQQDRESACEAGKQDRTHTRLSAVSCVVVFLVFLFLHLRRPLNTLHSYPPTAGRRCAGEPRRGSATERARSPPAERAPAKAHAHAPHRVKPQTSALPLPGVGVMAREQAPHFSSSSPSPAHPPPSLRPLSPLSAAAAAADDAADGHDILYALTPAAKPPPSLPHARYAPHAAARPRPLHVQSWPVVPLSATSPSSSLAHRRRRAGQHAFRCLTVLTEHPDEPSMSLADMPDSPPDLSSSKSSSKSSSLHSSTSTRDDFHNVDNFEEISLNDSTPTGKTASSTPTPTAAAVAAVSSSSGRLGFKPRPLIRSIQSTPTPALRHGMNRSSPNLRDISTSARANASPSAFARGTRTPPSPLTVKPKTSSPSLRIPDSASRSLSPRYRERPLSPHSAQSSPSTEFPTSPVVRSRRGSAVRQKRRTADEIEQDYDSDDEIPEEAFIDNIPFSPRPQGATTPGSSPGRHSTPVFSPTARSKSTEEVARAKSWDAALLGLSPSMKELTSKLEDHADEVKRNSDPTVPRPVLNPRAATLPPVQRGNNLIDPLPPSKEKEKILSRTRPSWLPPKSAKEEKKHLKQYQRIMNDFIAAEKRRNAEAEAHMRNREEREASARRTWEMHVLPKWDQAMRDSQSTRELWWAGVPAGLRGQVWSRAVGNDLHLSKGSYEAALARARALEARLDAKPSSSSQNHEPTDAEITANTRSKRSIAAQKADIASAFPEHRLFQQGQTFHSRLRDVLAAYAAYRSDTGHVRGVAGIAALLLVHLPEPPAAFVTLANLLNRPTSLAFCINDHAAKERTYSRVLRAMRYKTPRLHERLHVSLRLSPDEYLNPLCRSLLTSHLEMAEAARVFDVLVFEGDGVLVRTIVGFLGQHEGKLYGEAGDVRSYLSTASSSLRDGQDGATRADSFMEWVRWAGKEEGARPQH